LRRIHMKVARLTLSVFLITLSSATFGQSGAQKSFDSLKTLAGTWEGRVTTVPKMDGMGDMANVQITLRVTSRGNAIVHEMKATGTADDPTRYDHPVTMLYMDGDRLLLTHYCDAGNRPRMEANASPDGKKVEFSFVDLSGGNEHGHMYHAVFTAIDANHHSEDWTYMMPGDKPVRAHMDLQRIDLQRTDLQHTKDSSALPGK
jgi:hypothetical protein